MEKLKGTARIFKLAYLKFIGMNLVEVKKDIDLILWSTRLSELYRYTHQKFWESEPTTHEYALRIEGVDERGKKTPRSESVA